MSIVRKVRSVERLFQHLDQEIHVFQSHTGLHCIAGCGKCCTKPDIDATPLEFLPYALHLYLNGKAEQVLTQLKNREDGVCIIYKPLTVGDPVNGTCTEYPYRGLICRLFGYGATRDKLGQLRLATCKIIKEKQAENFEKSIEDMKNGLSVPIFTEYYQKIANIDFRLGSEFVPINQALIMAIEEILHYYTYRPFPRHLKK
jgi:uncharacterized protein